MSERPRVEVITDGACSGNPGPGGWGVILRSGSREKELSGFEPATTNNRMEMMAAIEGLRALTRPCVVTLKTDSQYVQKGMTEWGFTWKRNGWRKKPGAADLIPNADLWQLLWSEAARHQVTWTWVRGHSGDPDNERADALARAAIVQNSANNQP
jgi:ribonuclease HI